MKFMYKQDRFKRLLTVALAMMTGLISACTNYGDVPTIESMPFTKHEDYPAYILQPGDNIDVKFFYSPDLNDNVTIRPDGGISLQLIGDVHAAGLTVQELDSRLTKKYRGKLPDGSDVSVIVKDFSDERIYVLGEVVQSGEYPLKHKLTVLQAIATAGGFNNSAKRDAVLIVRQQEEDAPRVYIAELKDENFLNMSNEGTYNMLYPRDIIIVPKSNIAKVDMFMDQYVQDVLRFNGFSAGISGVYELNNKDNLGVAN